MMYRPNPHKSDDSKKKATLLWNLLIGVLLAQCATQFFIGVSHDESIGANIYGECVCIIWGLFKETHNHAERLSDDDDSAFDMDGFTHLLLGGFLGEIVLCL